MKESKQFIIVITIFIFLSLLLNYFIVRNIFNSLNMNKGVIFYVILLFLALSYPSTAILERYKSTPLTKIFYKISAIWIGIAFFSLIVFLIYELVNIFFKIDSRIGSFIVLSLILALSIISLINGKRLKINSINIDINGLKKELKIVQLSDLHIGAIHQKKHLERIVNKTNSLNPDVVVITGDLVDGSTLITKEIISPINKIKCPIYFVTGNHETYEGLYRVIPILKKTKMKLLINEKSKFKNINFIGIDYFELKKKVHEKLNKIIIDKSKINILLYHAPIFRASYLEQKGIRLHLAGHTHGGQLFPLNLLVRIIFPYVRGLHQSEDSSVFVSVGAGTWGPPMRLGSTSEINLINLRKKKMLIN
jgi:predicted MPP superfamily phosphohydrolase